MRQHGWGAALVACAMIALASWWVQSRLANGSVPASVAPSQGRPVAAWWKALPSAERPSPNSTRTAPDAPTRSAEQLWAVLRKGSFAGTTPFGDWCVDAHQNLKACPLLRDRFEYYFNGLGEITPAEVRVLVEDDSMRANGESLTLRIMAIFDQYWALRRHEYAYDVVAADRSTWMPALQERRQVRSQMLGHDWAKAFYEEEDQELLATFQQLESGQPPVPGPRDPVPSMAPGKDPAAVRAERVVRYGEEAAQKLERVDADEAQFDRDMVEARAEWARLAGAANLSASDREAQIKRYVESHFAAVERRRAAALVKLPPP